MKTVFDLVPIVLAFSMSFVARPAEPEWKVGLATIKITPDVPVTMAGYAGRNKPYTKVEQDIFAKAMAFDDQRGDRAILITTDLLGLPAVVAEPVRERIQRATKLERGQILLSSSHAHSAPTLSLDERAESGIAQEDARNTVTYRDNGAVLGQEVCRVLAEKLRPITGKLICVTDQVRLPLQSFNRAQLDQMSTNGPSWQSGNAKGMIAKLARGEKLADVYECPVTVWQFGTNLTMVGLSGEVVSDYVPLLEKAIGPLQLWIAAYCNDVFGYFPSARILQEGGYESRGLYTTTGFFAPAAQDILVSKVRDLAQRAGRKMTD